jgi:hypothetical protein
MPGLGFKVGLQVAARASFRTILAKIILQDREPFFKVKIMPNCSKNQSFTANGAASSGPRLADGLPPGSEKEPASLDEAQRGAVLTRRAFYSGH